MSFQFPSNPEAGDQVINPITGTSYVWVVPPGKWSVATTPSVTTSIYSSLTEPPVGSRYELWFDNTTETLRYYYVNPDTNTADWVTTAFSETSTESLVNTINTLSNVIIDLQTKVDELENSAFLLME